jgi:hypothetical protein
MVRKYRETQAVKVLPALAGQHWVLRSSVHSLARAEACLGVPYDQRSRYINRTCFLTDKLALSAQVRQSVGDQKVTQHWMCSEV